MEAKKKSHLQLERNSGLYFVLGLTAILALIYLALEWKTYYQTSTDIGKLNIPDYLEEEVPVTIHKLQPPPQPKIQAAVIEIAPDVTEIEETVIQSTEPDPNAEILAVDEIEVAKDEEPEVVPWILIEDAPVFPGCEGETDKKACFQEMIQKHIRKHFRYPELAQEMGLQGRVNVLFTIQKDGSISEIRLRGPHQSLEDEASRIISKLPRMTPGKQRGTPVKVPFAIPITFKLQ